MDPFVRIESIVRGRIEFDQVGPIDGFAETPPEFWIKCLEEDLAAIARGVFMQSGPMDHPAIGMCESRLARAKGVGVEYLVDAIGYPESRGFSTCDFDVGAFPGALRSV